MPVAPARGARPGLVLGVYRHLARLLQPVSGVILRRRAAQGKEDPHRRGERLGVAAIARPAGPLIWLHAASVGETNAVIPVIMRLRQLRPTLACLLTTGTVTSARLAEDRLDGLALHQYVPLDGPDFVARFLSHWRPDLAIFVESEIWPNLLLETSRRAIPIAVVNGRMSAKSFRTWQKRRSVSGPLFSRLDLVLAQNRELAERFVRLGVRNVYAVGNLKADAPAPLIDELALRRLKEVTRGRPILLAASTHPGEEEGIFSTFRAIERALPGLLLIVAPRHPDRGTLILESAQSAGFKVAQRSRGDLPELRHEIYLADTIGELGTLYSLSHVAVIGGSFAGKGGQNPLEAAKLHCAIISGPDYHNFEDEYAALIANGACTIAQDFEQLAGQTTELLLNHDERGAMLQRADAAVRQLGGALARTMALLEPLLPEDPGLQRVS